MYGLQFAKDVSSIIRWISNGFNAVKSDDPLTYRPMESFVRLEVATSTQVEELATCPQENL